MRSLSRREFMRNSTKAATGIVSVVGFTPDVFMPMIGGVLLGRFPGAQGYRFLFMVIAGLCVLGLPAAVVIRRKYAVHGAGIRREKSSP